MIEYHKNILRLLKATCCKLLNSAKWCRPLKVTNCTVCPRLGAAVPITMRSQANVECNARMLLMIANPIKKYQYEDLEDLLNRTGLSSIQRDAQECGAPCPSPLSGPACSISSVDWRL